MAQETDESKTSILPDAELNPLLNPLLASHMGRWAEVYFTSPPEKRTQAVSDLVRELSNHPRSETGPAQTRVSPRFPRSANEDPKMYENRIEPVPPSSADTDSSLQPTRETPESTNLNLTFSSPIVCEACGHHNQPQQRFCGMCGTPLLNSANHVPSSDDPNLAEPGFAGSAFAESDSVQPSSPQPRLPDLVAERVEEENPEPLTPAADELRSVHETPRRGWNESYESTPTPRRAAEDYPAEAQPIWTRAEDRPAEYAQFNGLSAYESEPASHGYRIYIGLVVAVLLGLLVYMTWRSNNALWSSGGVLPGALPAAKSETPEATDSAPAPAQPQPKANTTSPEQPPPATETSPQPPKPAPENNLTPAQPSVARSATARLAPSRTAPNRKTVSRGGSTRLAARVEPIKAQSSAAAGQDGSEELAAAEKYLNSGSGSARNSQQAASLLWKAVAKQNSTATLLLSDLYLRGDGVAKSCDQARLLLDAAARKGATAAAQRLRNLPAFGCR